MTHLKWISYPYQHFIQSWIPHTIPVLLGLSAILIILDLALPSNQRRRGRFAILLVAVNLLLIQNQYLTSRATIDVVLIACATLICLVYGFLYHRSIAAEWSQKQSPIPWWIGLVIIALITGIKLVDLSTWPPFLKAYAAMTGRYGMRAVEGEWPAYFFQGRGFDLRGGGQSPLMLPIMFVTMKWFGVSPFSVRFSEVLSSTFLLLVFWAWIRRSLPGFWSCIALLVFGLSPWHLAQSRMGTFFSISVCVAIAILWSSQNAWQCRDNTRKFIFWMVLIGLLGGCIGWCYAPMKVLYPFCFAALAGIPLLNRLKPPKWWIGVVAGFGAFAVILGLQLASVQNPKSMFRSHFGPLATDNPVWRKTVDDKVTAGQTQPVGVIAANIRRNAVEWMRKTFQERGIQPMYSFGLVLSIIPALLCLILRWNPILGLYYLTGLLPPLIVFPLHRRSLIVWPLVFVVITLVFRELSITGSQLFNRKHLKKVIPVIVLTCLLIVTFQNMFLLIQTWSIVYDHVYFGPAWRLTAMDRAAELIPDHNVVFINPWVHRDIIEITLYEDTMRWGGDRLQFAGIRNNAKQLRQYLTSERPTSFFYFDLDNQQWMKDALFKEFPEGNLSEVREKHGKKILLYSVFTVNP